MGRWILFLGLTLGAVLSVQAGSMTDQIAALEAHKQTTPSPVASHATNAFTDRYQLVLFYMQHCSHCQRFDPILRQVADQGGLSVFAYTLDGGTLPSFPNAVPAPPSVIHTFFQQGIPIATPTLFMVNVNTLKSVLISQGEVGEGQLNARLHQFFEYAKRGLI